METDIIKPDGIYNIKLKTIKQMLFIFNALENGWSISKKKDYYVFSKKHKGEKEILQNDYLAQFVEKNTDLKKIVQLFKYELDK